MPRHLTLTIAVAALACASATTSAQQQQPAPAAATAERPFRLMVGDQAPPLTVEKWLRGEPVPSFEKGKIYVVEFWATWCGPCIAAMPHLTELQAKHRSDGVTIIGMTSVDPGNSLQAVEKFVASKDEKSLGYTLAWDKGNTTNRAYMTAAFQRGIPCSFVIDREGRIAHIGHPNDLDDVLRAVLDGTHDIEAAARKYAAGMSSMAPLARLHYAISDGDVPRAAEVYAELMKSNARFARQYTPSMFNLYLKRGTPEQFAAFAAEQLEASKDDAQALNSMAWAIVDPDAKLARRDLDFALRAAERAAELTGHKEAAILDTLAMAHYHRGDLDKAIEIQSKAVDLVPDTQPALAESLAKRLTQFRDEQTKRRN